jgi:erythromycin esterase
MDRIASMNRVSRRAALGAGGTCLGAALVPTAVFGQSTDDDALQRWIEQEAVRIDAGVEGSRSARDVEPLLAAIGDARVVMLGEPSHGAGSAFAAKVRLVRLLHERRGFDVLAWESGLIDLERTEAALRGDLDPGEAARRGIFGIWSASAECQPLFAYAKASHGTARPLTMAGFDMQLTAPGTFEHFSAELRAFVRTTDPARRDRAQALAERVLEHFGRLSRFAPARAAKAAELGRAGITGAAQSEAMQRWDQTDGDAFRPGAGDHAGLAESAGTLVRLLGDGREGVAGVRAGRAGFMARAVTSLAGYGANLLERYGRHPAETAARSRVIGENRRDRIMADNLRWLIDTAYAGRKVIVWAHNAHVMNAWYGPAFDRVSLEPLADGMKPLGVWVDEWYRDRVYTIGFTAWQGSDGFVGAPPAALPPAPSGSLEERLHRLAAPEVFLPLRGRAARSRLPVASVSLRIPKYEVETVANPAQPFDALYFIDTMQPATAI